MTDVAGGAGAAHDATVEAQDGPALVDPQAEEAKFRRKLAIAQEAQERINASVDVQAANLSAKKDEAQKEVDRWAGLLAGCQEGDG